MDDNEQLLELAEAAYNAYGDEVEWVAHTGKPMPSWRSLPDHTRTAWVASVRRVKTILANAERPADG